MKDNILEGFDYDKVMDFDYLPMCYSESLRIEPPVAVSGTQAVINDTEMAYGDKKLNIKAGT